ncbi:MAG TPA: DegT/DnrJ/EryC1/StrS family aminotransferase, partial [Thermoanaerobaculia bacterium]|nr:DegT/DnrJ/EryC1/StrS family aminotransferase [Thermoanaerobaculia bacterium]
MTTPTAEAPTAPPVPIMDLGRTRQRIEGELQRRWQRILDTSAFVLGPELKEFERAWAEYLGVAASVGLANGTDALVLAAKALGLAP